MTDFVLDSSAVLAWINMEPGAAEVGDRAVGSWMSAVNLAEVVSKLVERGHTPSDAVTIAKSLPCAIVAFDESLALATGLMRAPTRRYGLSLGDRACLALASQDGRSALTADRAWTGVDIGVEIRMLR